MKKQCSMRTRSVGLSRGQRLIACVLLLLVVFLVINPLCECHDHMDNLRHLGAHGFLATLLLIVSAGIALTKALRWIHLKVSRVWLMSPQLLVIHRQAFDKFSSLLGGDLPLPLRI